MTYLTEEERSMLLVLIDARISMISGRVEGALYPALVALRRKIEGTDKRIKVEDDRADTHEEALHKIKQWSEAYPLQVFPEPDLKKARALLQAGGITLDAVSAHCMRHAVEGVGKIAREALEAKP